MTDTYLDLIDKLNKNKAELRHWQIEEQIALDNIQSFIHIQAGLNDEIETQEATIRQLRYSEQPKTWFQKAFR